MVMTENNSTPWDAASLGDSAAQNNPPIFAPRPARPLPPAAQRALAEAQARRAEIDRKILEQPKELNGRNGPDPARYGDWEVRGIVSDF
jgi:hypothetical protein